MTIGKGAPYLKKGSQTLARDHFECPSLQETVEQEE